MTVDVNSQYIGARYVPKFYVNPDDESTNWKAGVTYEALTIVTYNGDSYTSPTALVILLIIGCIGLKRVILMLVL